MQHNLLQQKVPLPDCFFMKPARYQLFTRSIRSGDQHPRFGGATLAMVSFTSRMAADSPTISNF